MREERLARALVGLTDTLVQGFDVLNCSTGCARSASTS